jgi:ParB/RepB/Spo0J family partition protein
MGNIKALAASIEAVGLLHPVVVTPDSRLIAGERRLEACKALGWTNIPVTVVSLDAIVRGEFAENMDRKSFTPTEEVAIWRALEPEQKQAAKERETLGKVSPGSEKGRVRDKVAAFVGKSGRTLEKQVAIVEAAEAEPENKTLQKLVEDMDRTGRVDGPHKRLVVARKAEAIKREPPPLPKGPHRVIVADPPWPYELRKADPSHRATHPYPQMSIDDIKAMDVAGFAHDDCILWLWVTNHHMREAFGVLDAWGFEQKTILTWVKHKFGTGDWLRGQTEHCLMAVRGRPTVTLTNQSTVLHGPLRGNSEKPDEFYAFVESLCPAPEYCELFQRTPRAGWIGHGDEVAPA